MSGAVRLRGELEAAVTVAVGSRTKKMGKWEMAVVGD